MKKNNTLKVLLITILFTLLLTWLLPITYYNGGLNTDVRYPAGIFDIFNYPTLTLYYFGTTAIYVLMVGAFYGVFNKTGIYRKICDKIVKLFHGKEKVFLITVIALLSIIVAFCGLGYELFFLLPLLASIILLMNYDRVTVAITFIGSIAVGFAGSLFASQITGTYLSSLTIEYKDLIWFRVILLVLGIALLSIYVIRRTKKLEKVKEDNKDLIPEKIEVKSKKGKVKASWPAILIFDLILLLMILGTLNFNAFGVNVFEKFHESVMTFAIKDYTIFAKILGSAINDASFGNWAASEFITVMILGTLVLALVYRIKLSDLFADYKEGARKFGLSAFLMLLAYTVLIVVSNHPVLLTILKPLLEATKGFNSVTLSVSMFIASIFNVDVYYTSSAMLPYVTSLITDTSVYPLVGFVSQVMHGLAVLVAPTSIVLLGVISYLDISYTKWIKNIWKFALSLLLLAFILFIIIVLI